LNFWRTPSTYIHNRVTTASTPSMVRAKCPTSLRKFGFCGILAIIYAARLQMPSSIPKLKTLLDNVKKILCMKKGKWTRATPKHTGAISISDTICLLHHYKSCNCTVLRTKHDDAPPTLRKWIKGVQDNTCYIVHLRTHAFFVEVGSVKSKWRIYDQGGVHTKKDIDFMQRVGGYGGQQIRAILEITYGMPQNSNDSNTHVTQSETA